MRTKESGDKTCGAGDQARHWCKYCQQWECGQCYSACQKHRQPFTDLKYYIHECHRYMFLSKIYLHDKSTEDNIKNIDCKRYFNLIVNSELINITENDVTEKINKLISNIDADKWSNVTLVDINFASEMLCNWMKLVFKSEGSNHRADRQSRAPHTDRPTAPIEWGSMLSMQMKYK